MLVAMVCYFGVCIALLFDLRGSAHERRQSATRTVSQEAREAATEWEAALADSVSPQRAPTKSSSPRPLSGSAQRMDMCDAPPRPMSFKEPAPRPQMIRRLESARSMNTSRPSTRTLQASKSEPSMRLLGATEDSASKSPRPLSAAKPQRADARRGALSGHVSSARPFVSSSARFYAEVVSRQQAALLRAGSEQRATLAKELPKQINTTFR